MSEQKESAKAVVTPTGYMLGNRPDYPRVPSWPDFIWIIFLCMFFITILIWGISSIFYAPLEEVAEWAKTPNPAKAPWYFIGLQELLVYFDPWIAGVILPTQIIIGLALIPYVDISPDVQGYYNYSDRKFAFVFFSFGMFLWFLLIVVGQWLRGPSWEIYWPIIDYPLGGHEWVYPGQPLKESQATLYNMSLPVGLVISLVFFGGGMVLPMFLPFKQVQDYIRKLGPIKYALVQIHVLLTLSVVAKMVMRLAFNVKYVIVTPWFKI